MQQTELTPAEFVGLTGLTLAAQWVATMPANQAYHDPTAGNYPVDRWRCRVQRGGKSFKVEYHMAGKYGRRAPTTEEVIASLANDAFSDYREVRADEEVQRYTAELRRILGEEYWRTMEYNFLYW